ncbi:GLPGLI family protein [Frigoriflavimonas asaccharolytica]|uniref:GLPGLI family protein n=1 Tax=Frigoriflavimonas asaccharolytica TaxID=2735899 RepID=A0A8J8G5M3_9FLAO|nr:GLPGLI family protein [Frigoriflavimonas asaccharolytica]NRS91689.1 GLPGLI family protein [Frigoriflavimonas asaccharolytica]
MKLILAFIIFIFSSIILNAQQIKVKYKYVRSPIVTIYENLYINKKGNVISIQDSLISNSRNSNNLNPNGSANLESKALYFISDLNIITQKDFVYLDIIGENTYFVYDQNVPRPNWKIDYKNSKTFAGFLCYKAEAVFRGSKIIAYFSKEIPYSSGPYKFFGLPGLILDVRVEGKDYDLWKVESVDLDNKEQINFKPKLNQYNKIQMKDFVNLKDEDGAKFQKKLQKVTPMGSTRTSIVPSNRFGVETKYEWE